MPLSEQQRQTLDETFGDQRPDLGLSLDVASRRDPESHAENLYLSDSMQLPVDTVERNTDEVKRLDKLKRIDLDSLSQSHPKTSDFLRDPDNASLALDDLDILKGMEDIATTKDRTWGEFAEDTGIDLGKGTIGFGEGLIGLADILTFNLVGDGLEAIGYRPEEANQFLSEFYSAERQRANRRVQEAEGFFDTLTTLAQEPSAALGTIVESTPVMLGVVAAARLMAAKMLAGAGIRAGTPEAAAFLSRPDVIARLATTSAVGEGAMAAGMTQESARQAGRTWKQSVVPSVMAGMGTAVIGKFSSKILPDVEATAAAAMASGTGVRSTILDAGKNIAKGMFKEGVLEELPQSAQEAVWENIALGRQWDEGVGEAAAQGLVAGTGMGFGMTASTEAMGAIRYSGRQGEVAVKSVADQQIIDKAVTLSQDSKLRGLAPERFEQFLNAVGPDRQVFVPADIASQIPNAPDYITQQLDGAGGDVAIPFDKFASEIASNEEVMNLIRPHLKMDQNAMSINELQEDDTSVRTLLERAQASQDVKTESDRIYDEVKSQLVGTGRQAETTARLSAQIIPAYVATKAERLGISPQEVYESMGLKVTGPAAPEPAVVKPTVIVEQPPTPREQDFSGIQLTEKIVIEETGETATVTQDAQRVWEQTQKRRDMVDKLRDCLRG